MYFSHLAHSLTNSWVPKIAPPFSFAQHELTPVTEAKSAPGSQRHSGKAQPPPQDSWGSPCPAEDGTHSQGIQGPQGPASYLCPGLLSCLRPPADSFSLNKAGPIFVPQHSLQGPDHQRLLSEAAPGPLRENESLAPLSSHSSELTLLCAVGPTPKICPPAHCELLQDSAGIPVSS